MSIESKLLERNTPLPTYKLSSLPLEPAVITGNLVFVSGNTPIEGDVLLCKGTVGVEVSVEQARKCAEACVINCLSALKYTIGDLERVHRIVNLCGFVSSQCGFTNQPAVINAASELLIELFGDKGRHARSAIGVSSLPGGAPVEIELVVEIE